MDVADRQSYAPRSAVPPVGDKRHRLIGLDSLGAGIALILRSCAQPMQGHGAIVAGDFNACPGSWAGAWTFGRATSAAPDGCHSATSGSKNQIGPMAPSASNRHAGSRRSTAVGEKLRLARFARSDDQRRVRRRQR